MTIGNNDDFEQVEISEFADPDADVILLDLASGGNTGRLRAIQEALVREERRGRCALLHMDDDIAVVRWASIITITDPATRALMGIDHSDMAADAQSVARMRE